MVVLAKPCSCFFKLQTNNNNMACMPSSLITTATLTTNPPTTYPFHKISLIMSTTRPRTLVKDQVLIKEDDQQKVINKELDEVIMRLKMVVERLREMEIQKLMRKLVKGEDQLSTRIVAEEMSREIFSKFFEKPIEYLTSDAGCLQQKLKDVHVLLSILEKSCPNQ